MYLTRLSKYNVDSITYRQLQIEINSIDKILNKIEMLEINNVKTLDNFYAALQRLKEGKPKFIDFPYSINNDTVSLEAQRKRGTIKKSRPELTQLIIDIAKAEAIRTGKQLNPSSTNVQDDKLKSRK